MFYNKNYILFKQDSEEEIIKKHKESGARITFKNSKAIRNESSSSEDASHSQNLKVINSK